MVNDPKVKQLYRGTCAQQYHFKVSNGHILVLQKHAHEINTPIQLIWYHIYLPIENIVYFSQILFSNT